MRASRILTAVLAVPLLFSLSASLARADVAPVVTAPATAGAPENSLVNFTVTAADPDGDAISDLLASGGAITAGGTFTRNASFTAGTFNWTPNFTRRPPRTLTGFSHALP